MVLVGLLEKCTCYSKLHSLFIANAYVTSNWLSYTKKKPLHDPGFRFSTNFRNEFVL